VQRSNDKPAAPERACKPRAEPRHATAVCRRPNIGTDGKNDLPVDHPTQQTQRLCCAATDASPGHSNTTIWRSSAQSLHWPRGVNVFVVHEQCIEETGPAAVSCRLPTHNRTHYRGLLQGHLHLASTRLKIIGIIDTNPAEDPPSL
jgi:hypothetical protein